MNRDTEPPKPAIDERRAQPRHPFRWPVTIVFAGNRAALSCQGATQDISVEGCAVLTEHNIAPGTPVAIRIALPPKASGAASEIVEIDGHITYTVFATGARKFRSGIAFLKFRQDGERVRAIKQRTG